MLDKDRIKEAEANIHVYLREELIKKQDFKDIVFNVLTNNAHESLAIAESVKDKSDLWTIVISYYSMFYIANAVLYKLGYKVGDKIAHKVTADALIVYVRKRLKDSLLQSYEEIKEEALAGILADKTIKSFDQERIKRNRIQYHTNEQEKHTKAITSLMRAKEFMLEMEKLL
jgi:uncharacterized protein (UPF0332 family)